MGMFTRVDQPPDDDENKSYTNETAEEEGLLSAPRPSTRLLSRSSWLKEYSIKIHLSLLFLNALMLIAYTFPWSKPTYIAYPDIATSQYIPLQLN